MGFSVFEWRWQLPYRISSTTDRVRLSFQGGGLGGKSYHRPCVETKRGTEKINKLSFNSSHSFFIMFEKNNQFYWILNELIKILKTSSVRSALAWLAVAACCQEIVVGWCCARLSSLFGWRRKRGTAPHRWYGRRICMWHELSLPSCERAFVFPVASFEWPDGKKMCISRWAMRTVCCFGNHYLEV